MMLSIGSRMFFWVRTSKAEADDANTLRLRHLHSLFFDDNHAHNGLMSNSTADFTSDHYFPPAAADDDPSKTSRTLSLMMWYDPTNHTQANNSIDELSDNSHYQKLSKSLPAILMFVVLILLYIGLFCSSHHSVGNEESSSRAANRAAEQSKLEELEERKKRIGKVLVSRLIVEDKDEEDVKVDLEKGENTRANAPSDFRNRGEDDEENQVVMNDKDEGYDDDEEEIGMKEAAAEEKTRAQDEDAASDALAEQDEQTLSTSTEETTVATSSSSSSEETTIDTIPSNSNEVVPTIDTSSSSSSFMVAVSSSPPPSPFRKYADALFCKNCHTQNNDTSNNNTNHGGNKSPSDSSRLTTVTLSAIQQTYGEEECIICFSNFQVGDLVAWSKHQINECTHVFHDDCLTRWLLVRDCCPMCRRSYGVVG